jgi:hypothetical protein
MSYIRIKTIKGKQYAYRQTSVRKGKKVKTISEYLGAIAMSPLIAVALATGYGKRGSSSGHKPTDKRQIREEETADREIFHKDRAMFNVKQRQDYERQQKGRDASKEAREAKMSKADKQERAQARAADAKKAEEVMDAVREFNRRGLSTKRTGLNHRNRDRQMATR